MIQSIVTCWMVMLVSSTVAGGYRPFLEPIPERGWWPLLLIPLAIAIAVVYKTIKLEDLSRLRRDATRLSLQIIAFMAMAGVFLWLVVGLVT